MNIVLRNPSAGRDEFFIACIKKNGAYYVYGRYVSPEGKLRTMSKCGRFDTVSAATDRCRSLARNKVRKKGFEVVLREKSVAKNIYRLRVKGANTSVNGLTLNQISGGKMQRVGCP